MAAGDKYLLDTGTGDALLLDADIAADVLVLEEGQADEEEAAVTKGGGLSFEELERRQLAAIRADDEQVLALWVSLRR